ncbi:hypothetical protein JCM10908_002376 [Rhodotorula pacifica]|uniref:uncharacterized protein n=1 Tax=Rhodotorula pacifica TaxID=1495444 RepID=UPI003178F464
MAQEEAHVHGSRAESPQPIASTSSSRPSPSRYGAVSSSGAGPLPPAVAAHREQRHSRRPSRAERYETVVANARETLRRATGGYDEAELQIGPASDPLLAERRRRSKRLSSASFEPLPERDWRETVRSLLNVVDGMSQQLAAHDELATELKIAQSNLSLASAHSEFLEETLRRRESRTSASHLMSRQHSTGEQLPSLPSSSRRGSADTASHDPNAASAGLFGLGLLSEADSGGAKSFFRLPSKRRSPNPAVPAPTESTATTITRRLRSVGSSPVLNKGFFSAEPAPPLPPRDSTSTTASSDFPTSPNPSVEANSATSPLAAEVFSLRTQVSSLDTECTALRSSNASLKRNNETLVAKCAALEKTKDDLLAELENLSVELFSEANALVAEERRARAKAEEEVERLTAKIATISADLDALRLGGHKNSPTVPADPLASSPRPPSISHSASPLIPTIDSSQQLSASPTSSSIPIDPVSERPQSVASIASSAARNWFSFGRGSSQSTPATEVLPPLPGAISSGTSASLPGEGTFTGQRESPSSPVLATSRQGQASAPGPPNGNATQSATAREHDLPPLPPTSIGKEKARTLDLGISIPDARGGHDVASAFSASPGSAGTATSGRTQRSAENGRSPYVDLSAVSPRSPDLRLPRSPELRSPHSPLLPSLPAGAAPPDRNAATSPSGTESALSIPTRRPRKPDGQVAPRPYGMHYDRTPPGLHADFLPSSGTIGGPSASEMTAGSKSPKSPNELRWAKVSGNLQPGSSLSPPTSANHQLSSSSSLSSTSKPRKYGSGESRRRATTDLPPTPTEAETSRQDVPPKGDRPPDQRQRSASALQPAHPPASSSPQQHRPTLQPVDTTSTTLAPPAHDSSRRRPHSAGTGSSAHPGFPRANHGAASYSTAQAALASGPASAHPAGPASSSASGRSPLTSHSAGGAFPSTTTYSMQHGMTTSSSLSSLASNSSLSSIGAPSSSGHSGAGGSRHGGLASPADDTKAAQDLENLMQNILEMSEGLFGQGEVPLDGDHAVAAKRDADGGQRVSPPAAAPRSSR